MIDSKKTALDRIASDVPGCSNIAHRLERFTQTMKHAADTQATQGSVTTNPFDSRHRARVLNEVERTM